MYDFFSDVFYSTYIGKWLTICVIVIIGKSCWDEVSKINKKSKINVIIVHDIFGFNVILSFQKFKGF